MSRAGAILALRRVAGHLAQPAPGLLENLGAVESYGLLTLDLPLADVSPFGALPASAGPEEGSQAARPVRRIVPPQPAAEPPLPAPGATKAQTGPANPQAPVFSFRRGAAAPPPFVEQAPSPPARFDLATPRTKLGTEEPGAEEPAALYPAASTPPQFIAPAQAWPAEGSKVHALGARTQSGSLPVLNLLDVLATEMMAANTPSPVSPPEGSPTHVPGWEPSATTSADAGHSPRGVDRGSVELTARLWAQAATPIPEGGFAREASLPPPSAAGAARAAALRQGLPPDVGAALANLDAETLASMVNEVLVEQARRHGVDLS